MHHHYSKGIQLVAMACLLASAPVLAAKPPGKGGSAGDIEELLARVEALETENSLQGADIDNLKSATAGQDAQIAALGARMDNAESGVGSLVASVAANQGLIDDLLVDAGLLQAEIAALRATNEQQQQVITSLRNVLRSNRKLARAQAARSNFGNNADFALELGTILDRTEQETGTPVEISALSHRAWVQRARDIGESTRCLVANLDKAPHDDCVLSDGTEIELEDLDSVVLSQEQTAVADNVQIVMTEMVIEPFISEMEAQVNALPGPSVCDVWKRTRGILAEYSCLHYLGKWEARQAVLAYQAMTKVIDASSTDLLDEGDFVQGQLGCESDAVTYVPGGGAVICEQEDPSDLVGTWESIEIKGEQAVRNVRNCSKYDNLYDFNACLPWDE
ncbi:hypothetical protein F3N42_00485 [Marinihelvus fidelis]|uniref:Secreted protein n=1 Tax=Marinihelvus fidelis TaxID=2613842 RepID=A0A5N0TG89_9GAMM|nr:hypothetical protein [Marinihelvus fidelis]KAA9134062.1 hypothetical protein F3N42_00485 [Marinihelvus fidelis]